MFYSNNFRGGDGFAFCLVSLVHIFSFLQIVVSFAVNLGEAPLEVIMLKSQIPKFLRDKYQYPSLHPLLK